MLKRISVRNLACFSDADNHIEFAPETVIIGPNNVGKSAMIAAFNALRVSLFRGMQWVWTPLYNWGSFDAIVHRHELQRRIQIITEVQGTSWSGTITGTVERNGTMSLVPEPREGSFHQELARIWYLRASRNDIPSQEQIGVRSDQQGPPVLAQPLHPDGSNVVSYLLERFTDQDSRWPLAQEWLKRIDPESMILKSPLRGFWASLETTQASGIDVNLSYQGTGIQKALSIMAAVIFSPESSTIIIEEPESHLHPRSQEVLVDLFNLAVNDWKKQIIFTTHSWDMLHPFSSDIGEGKERGKTHIKANPENFRLIVFKRRGVDVEISELKIQGMPYYKLRDYLKELWG